MKRLGLLIGLIIITSMLVACAGAGQPPAVQTPVAEEGEEPEAGSPPESTQEEPVVVTLGMNQELEFLNVMYTQGGNSLEASKMAQRGLLFLDEEGNWVGELAIEVPSVDNGLLAPDGSQITYNLREGVTFHDGTPVTSADVKATWEAIMNPDNTPITRLGYDKIESIETPDDHTVVMNFREPFASWKILFDFILPEHVIEENTPGLDESQAMREPIGFGPFEIVQWQTGEFIEYRAFDDYWRGRPNIDRFFIQIFPSTEALLAALEAKAVDIAWGLRAANIPKLRELEPQGIRAVSGKATGCERYHMNADESQAPIFADRELRAALHHAVDKQFIIDNLLHGVGEPALTSWCGSPFENPDLEPYGYDLDRAGEILDFLGWRDEDGDGIREAHGVEGFEDGTPLRFTHTTTSGVLQREQVQLLVQQMFRDIGADMVIENRRTAELFGTWQQGGVWAHGNYEMGGWSHGLRLPDPEISNRFLCSDVPSEDNPTGAQWHRYCNPEMDEFLLEAQSEFDAEQRLELIYNAQEVYHNEAYTIYLFTTPRVYGVREELKGFEPYPFTRWYGNAHNWEWEE